MFINNNSYFEVEETEKVFITEFYPDAVGSDESVVGTKGQEMLVDLIEEVNAIVVAKPNCSVVDYKSYYELLGNFVANLEKSGIEVEVINQSQLYEKYKYVMDKVFISNVVGVEITDKNVLIGMVNIDELLVPNNILANPTASFDTYAKSYDFTYNKVVFDLYTLLKRYNGDLERNYYKTLIEQLNNVDELINIVVSSIPVEIGEQRINELRSSLNDAETNDTYLLYLKNMLASYNVAEIEARGLLYYIFSSYYDAISKKSGIDQTLDLNFMNDPSIQENLNIVSNDKLDEINI